MFGVMQLSYFSLSSYDYVPPLLASILTRREINGLNVNTATKVNYNIPARVFANGFTSEIYLDNFNVMLLVILIFTVVGIVLYTITYIISRPVSYSQ